MSIFLPFRLYLIASCLTNKFSDINFRNRFAACLACLTSDEELIQNAFLEIIMFQDSQLDIDLPDSKHLIRFEKERYSFFLNSNLVRIEPKKSEVHEILFEYLSSGSARINKFLYIHNYLNIPDFLFFVFSSNLISPDDFKIGKYISKLAQGLTTVNEPTDFEYIKDTKLKIEKCVYSLKAHLPLDVSQYDPIFTIATN